MLRRHPPGPRSLGAGCGPRSALFSLLVAVAPAAWAIDSELLTATLKADGPVSGWYEDEYGWQSLEGNVELDCTLQGVFAQQSGALSLYQLTNKKGSLRFWGTAHDVWYSGSTGTARFDFRHSFNLASPSGVLHYLAKSNLVTYAGFSLGIDPTDNFRPYHVRFYDTNGPPAPVVRTYFGLSSNWLLPDWADTDGSAAVRPFMLSFDDGPIPGMSEKVLAALAAMRVQGRPVTAAFFLVGSGGDRSYYAWYETAPAVGSIKDCRTTAPALLAALGQRHVLGNHTLHHADFGKWQQFHWGSIQRFAESEILLCDQQLNQLGIPNRPKLFRPPYLQDDPAVFAAARAQGYKTIWAELVGDTWWPWVWGVEAQALAKLTLWDWDHKGPCVLGFHDNRQITQDHLAEVVDFLIHEGYTLVHFDPDQVPDAAPGGDTEIPAPLTLARTGPAEVRLAWPVTAPVGGIVLEQAVSTNGGGRGLAGVKWVRVTNAPVMAGGMNTLVFHAKAGAGFFRIGTTNTAKLTTGHSP